jgi:hypothetical protein
VVGDVKKMISVHFVVWNRVAGAEKEWIEIPGLDGVLDTR